VTASSREHAGGSWSALSPGNRWGPEAMCREELGLERLDSAGFPKSTAFGQTTTWRATCFLTLYGDPSTSLCWRGKTAHARHKMHAPQRHKMHADNSGFSSLQNNKPSQDARGLTCGNTRKRDFRGARECPESPRHKMHVDNFLHPQLPLRPMPNGNKRLQTTCLRGMTTSERAS
jgi:hypothetical protein